jgi:ribosomal protein S18 acetylase RimI-like enzyme
MGLSLRAVRPDDEPFLYRLYASTRDDEMALLNWPEAQKCAFLRMQFEAQCRHYAQFGAADFALIERDGRPVGRLYLDRRAGEIRIVDIALLPEERGRGIGTQMLRDVQTLADASGVPITLHVEQSNRALCLYRRLGFRDVRQDGIYLYMVRPAAVEMRADRDMAGPQAYACQASSAG